jgi:para-aminobenzoate synthetase/4-amino-4-deoxychorismate lyase
VFTTLRVGEREDAHLARLARSVEVLYGERLGEVELPASGLVRIIYVPGQGVRVEPRPEVARALPVVLTPYVLPGGLGEHKWLDRRLIDALSRDGTTPLFLDADGTLLEAGWAAVIVRRDGRLLTPREDGRILPSTSRPDAQQADIHLQPGDELFLSSAGTGVVPATNPARRGGTPRTPLRTGS